MSSSIDLGGVHNYRAACAEIAAGGYPEFVLASRLAERIPSGRRWDQAPVQGSHRSVSGMNWLQANQNA